ncbi:DUF6314 family protein [Cellulomonas xylanilytica]|uniref:DUF6314 domain-containing protein n=1 Tax=Cellulomonas xylanilytica TaxID=233583 RepID=A0A510V4E6_9CELL|nr:DUF6314 family protein [Cellulomonas xylanilytica]GEK21754.1 hypothetical protein CXY01_22740 [Cellulomonas xylanilytica]
MTVERFAGVWPIDRAIADGRAGLEGHLDGTARCEPTGDGGLSWVEEGVLSLGGDVRPAGRRLLLRDAGGAWVDVLFGDGRPFYRFELLDDHWAGEHGCGDDAYTVAGHLVGADCFVEVWHAVGPRKDYRLTTTYRRVVS